MTLTYSPPPFGNQQPTPWQQPPPYPQQPGYPMTPPGYPPAQQQYGQPQFPPPRPPRSQVPLVMGLVFAVVLVLGVITVLVLINDEDEAPTAAPSQSPSATQTSEEPTPQPSAEETTEETPTGDKISESEFDDWDFALGDVQLQAEKIDGWDYQDCTEFEIDGALTDMGCEYAIENAYEAESGDLKLDVIIMGMTDSGSAEEAADGDTITQDHFAPQDEGWLEDFEYGQWKRSSSGPYVVMTMCTAASSVDEAKAVEYLENMHIDQTMALAFR